MTAKPTRTAKRRPKSSAPAPTPSPTTTPTAGWDQLPHADFASTNNHPLYSGGQPQFDKIEHTIFADTAAMGLAIEAGEVDSHQGVPMGVPEVEARLLDDQNFTGYTGWGVGGRVLRFRADLEPFRNKLARQAVMMLVDGDRVRREFGGTYDIAGRMPWQPGSVAYTEGGGAELDPHPLSGDQDAVRAEAGRLFDAAGFTGGEVLKIDTIKRARRRARHGAALAAGTRRLQHRDRDQPAGVHRGRGAGPRRHLRALLPRRRRLDPSRIPRLHHPLLG